jgi:uncharacterized membrane protein YoaK (UPF0700 family)
VSRSLNPVLLEAQIRIPHKRTKSIAALALTFVAGFVDIAGLITVYDVFTAHMTGTTVRLGEHLLQRDWRQAAITGVVVAAFVLGSVIGRVIIEIGSRSRIRSIGSITLAIEVALLAGVIAMGMHAVGFRPQSLIAVCSLLALLAGAMGLQTATVTRIGALTVHTTFVTGMLNKLAQLLSHFLFRSYDLRRIGSSAETGLREQRHNISRQARFLFFIWLFYLAGAFSGTWFTERFRFASLIVPCCILVVVIAVDQARPLSIEEEKDQSER